MKTYDKPKLLIIVGPTASGKTGLSIKLAKEFDGEVISADSRQVYKGMDIGSAKVTPEEMDGIPHHLLDVADPKETYTAADFKRDATIALEDILKRGKLPIICGGSFFYVDALLGRATLPKVEPNPTLRAELEEKSAAELFTILKELDDDRSETIDKDNKRRLVRAIEIAKAIGKVPQSKKTDSPYDVLTIGLSINKDRHSEILRRRVIERIDNGMIEEVERLIAEGVTHERLEDFGLEYRYTSRYIKSEINKETLINEITTKSRQFTKRQLTWLKRDDSIKWFFPDNPEILGLVKEFLEE